MSNINIDYHVHSISPDAKMPMDVMCKGAIERGIKEIVFTDHYEFYAHNIEKPLFDENYLNQYFQSIDECRKEFEGKLSVKSGMEFGQLHYYPKKAEDIIKRRPFDYLIGSIHKIENVDLTKMELTERNQEWIGDAYYYHLLEMSEIGEFDCIGHLDYYKKFCVKAGLPDLFEKYKPFIETILKNVIKRGKGIEINTACMGGILEDTMPDIRTLKLYKELGGTIITVGSDSHKPERLGYGFDKVEWILKLVGFNTVAVYSQRKPDFIRI